MPSARALAMEIINAGDDQDHVTRDPQFAELQVYLQVVDDVVVDIGG